MKRGFSIYWIILTLVLFISACTPSTEPQEQQQTGPTGILVIESSPQQAEVYVDGNFQETTPKTLYNFPAGSHEIIIKKQGFQDHKSTVKVEAGRTEEFFTTLTPAPEQTTTTTIIDGTSPDTTQTTTPPEDTTDQTETTNEPDIPSNTINLTKFALYFDFINQEVTALRTSSSHIYFRTYTDNIHFTALNMAKIHPIEKPLNDVTKQDCINPKSAVLNLFSGNSICIKTSEGSIFAISGSWEEKPETLQWKSFD
tara:strand:- start:4879 stop:5643 length:765 start_codon:yes stop_codon:yes gene_type:complete